MASKQVATQNTLAFTREQIDLIKQTVARGATDTELQLFLYTAKRVGLDPLTKQIHAIKRWDSQAGKETMAIQTGIDGYRLIADRTGKLGGIDDAIFDREDKDHPEKATVTVYKIINGEKCPFTASARWQEYCAFKRDGTPMALWKKMPYLMLGKCAEALALRKAFPADLTGIYTFEEDVTVDGTHEVTVGKPVIEQPKVVTQPEKGVTKPAPQPEPSPLDSGQRTAVTNPEPAPEKPKRGRPRLQPRGEQPKVDRPNQTKLEVMLDQGGYSRGEFMTVAEKNQWLGRGRTWGSLDEVPDEMLAAFLPADEFEVVEGEMKKLRPTS